MWGLCSFTQHFLCDLELGTGPKFSDRIRSEPGDFLEVTPELWKTGEGEVGGANTLMPAICLLHVGLSRSVSLYI